MCAGRDTRSWQDISTPDATGIAVPVRDPAGKVVAALAIVLPNDDTARSRIAVLQAASAAVSRAMVYPAPPQH